MTETNITAQELIEQILAAGKNLAQDSKGQAQALSKKGQELAAKGENILIDKLGIDDSPVAREALRKGAATGAAAGALALLLSSRSARKVATLGGLAGLGVLAYRAHKDGKMPSTLDDVIGLIKGPKAEARAQTLLRAMVAAAKADGDIHPDELAAIQAQGKGGESLLTAALQQAPDARAIAALSGSSQESREIYAASCRIADGLNPKERDYLDRLAMALRLDPDAAAAIETQVRTG